MLNSDVQLCELPSDCKTLSKLLSPLGLKLEKIRLRNSNISLWVLKLVDSQVFVCAQKITWITTEDLMEDICKHVKTFSALDNSRFISNPFLGCNSLEEMEIRADLLGI